MCNFTLAGWVFFIVSSICHRQSLSPSPNLTFTFTSPFCWLTFLNTDEFFLRFATHTRTLRFTRHFRHIHIHIHYLPFSFSFGKMQIFRERVRRAAGNTFFPIWCTAKFFRELVRPGSPRLAWPALGFSLVLNSSWVFVFEYLHSFLSVLRK